LLDEARGADHFLSNDVRKEAATGKEDSRIGTASMTAQDEKTMERTVHTALQKFAAEILTSVYKVILVLVGVYLVYQYGLNVLGFLVAVVYMAGHAVGIW
jgi:ABC-type bacteriocin/lantibiotic exporter with double-glycine peptidase domain